MSLSSRLVPHPISSDDRCPHFPHENCHQRIRFSRALRHTNCQFSSAASSSPNFTCFAFSDQLPSSLVLRRTSSQCFNLLSISRRPNCCLQKLYSTRRSCWNKKCLNRLNRSTESWRRLSNPSGNLRFSLTPFVTIASPCKSVEHFWSFEPDSCTLNRQVKQ